MTSPWEKLVVETVVAKVGGRPITSHCEFYDISSNERPNHRGFIFRKADAAYDLVRQGLAGYEVKPSGLVNEIVCLGKLYRIYSYQIVSRTESVQLNGEPIGAATMPEPAQPRAVTEQVLEALDGSQGMTARQIGENVQCSRSRLFDALSRLQRGGQIEKRGSLYLCVPNSPALATLPGQESGQDKSLI